MDFMNKVTEISKKVGEGAEKTYKAVADKSGKIIKETQMRVKANDKEGDIESLYYDMGKTVYDMYKKGEDVGKVFNKTCKKIDKLDKEIKDMEVHMLYLRDLRKCENCGEVIGIENKYCPKCGDRQKPVKIKEEKKEEEKEESPIDRVCSKCGKIALDDEAFCTDCGNKI